MISSLYYQIFLLLGLVVSFEDWRDKRIKNHWIVWGMLACGLGFGYLLLNSVLGYRHVRLGEIGEHYFPWDYYPRVLAHLFLSFTAAFTLWRLSVWPAGDAKLYTLFAFFTALIDPNLPGFPLLLFIILLINIFVPAGLAFAGGIVLRQILRIPELVELEWRKWLKGAAERIWIRLKEAWPWRYDYLALFVNLFALFFVLRAFEQRFHRLAMGPFGHLMVYFLMFILWSRLAGLLRNRTAGVIALTAVSAGSVAGSFYLRWDAWGHVATGLKMTASFGMFLSLVRMIFDRFIERESLRELEVEQLRPGVVLSDQTWARLREEKALEGKLGERYSDGLSEEEAEAIKSWLAGRQAARTWKDAGAQPELAGYTVYRTIPFAVWIFLGTLLTLSRRGTVVGLLTPHFQRGGEALKAAVSRWLS